MTHPITKLLNEQAAFEAQLPKGSLFDKRFDRMVHQYRGVVSILSSDTMDGPTDYVPRALVAVLSASLHLKFNLASGLTREIPASENANDFKGLAKIIAKHYNDRPKTQNKQYELGRKFISDIANYGAECTGTLSNPMLSLLAIDDKTQGSRLTARKRIFTNTLTYVAQDLLGFVGIVDGLEEKNRIFTADEIFRGIHDVRRKILEGISPK